MEKAVRKIISYFLIGLVMVFTVISLLAIWGFIEIDFKDILKKSISSMLVIFACSAVILFISTVLIKDSNNIK